MSALQRAAGVVLLVAVVMAAIVLAGRPQGSPSDPAARTARLASELRCPVCQGLSVADSPSITARDIRADIDRRIAAGESDSEIRQAYVDRFGDWILLRPRAGGVAAMLWALPAVLFVAGATALGLGLRRWRRQPAAVPSAEDLELVAELRAERAVEGA